MSPSVSRSSLVAVAAATLSACGGSYGFIEIDHSDVGGAIESITLDGKAISLNKTRPVTVLKAQVGTSQLADGVKGYVFNGTYRELCEVIVEESRITKIILKKSDAISCVCSVKKKESDATRNTCHTGTLMFAR